MKVKTSIEISASKEQIWQAITDYAKWTNFIKGIIKVEILDNPNATFLGLKWRETRVMFGKEATEDMWITECNDNTSYATRAESHGSIYITRVVIEENNKTCVLSQEFEGIPQKFMGKIMMGLMGGMMKKSLVKGIYKDLEDIKIYVESL